MSLTCTTIDSLIESSLKSENKKLGLEWIPCSEITDLKPTSTDAIYYASREHKQDNKVEKTTVMLRFLENSEECTVSKFAKIYSLPTHEYNKDDDRFRRYSKWLNYRNELIIGFTKYDNKYYMVADKKFYLFYSRYGFCTACGILRCSPVWCICGHKELADGWTSSNKQLDEVIKKSQLQTTSANDPYLEWIPYDCTEDEGKDGRLYSKSTSGNYKSKFLDGLPAYTSVELIPLERTDDNLCYKLHPAILNKDGWVTVGFTYDEQTYYLIKPKWNDGICLACANVFLSRIKAFCSWCKSPRPLDWTTGNESLDLFITESWKNIKNTNDAYIQWIKYSLLTNVKEMISLPRGCTHIADWLDSLNKQTKVILKPIVDNNNFYQLTEEYPEILTPNNVWVIGITRKEFTQKYYLVFYYNVNEILDRLMRLNPRLKYTQYNDFEGIKKIGSGGYGTVYTAKYTKYVEEITPDNVIKVPDNIPEIVALKRFKKTSLDLFISEFRTHVQSSELYLLPIFGVTQDPETEEYIIIMQYVDNGSLLSYLEQNINKLTWLDKLVHLWLIAMQLANIHDTGIVHCDLHSGNILMYKDVNYESRVRPLICDFGLSRSINSRQPISTIRGVLPFIAPEVFNTYKFTKKSDIYSFGIIMHLMATGEPPFRDRDFDRGLACDIMGGLRPSMPDSAPDEYKKLAERCCDADPDKRPDTWTLFFDIHKVIETVENNNSDNAVWNTTDHNDVRPLSLPEKESKYSSKRLPAGDLPEPRNMDSVSVTRTLDVEL